MNASFYYVSPPPPPKPRQEAIITLTPEEQDEIVKTWKGIADHNQNPYYKLMKSISDAILKNRA